MVSFVRCDAKLHVPAGDDVAPEAGPRKLEKCSARSRRVRVRALRACLLVNCVTVGPEKEVRREGGSP